MGSSNSKTTTPNNQVLALNLHNMLQNANNPNPSTDNFTYREESVKATPQNGGTTFMFSDSTEDYVSNKRYEQHKNNLVNFLNGGAAKEYLTSDVDDLSDYLKKESLDGGYLSSVTTSISQRNGINIAEFLNHIADTQTGGGCGDMEGGAEAETETEEDKKSSSSSSSSEESEETEDDTETTDESEATEEKKKVETESELTPTDTEETENNTEDGAHEVNVLPFYSSTTSSFNKHPYESRRKH